MKNGGFESNLNSWNSQNSLKTYNPAQNLNPNWPAWTGSVVELKSNERLSQAFQLEKGSYQIQFQYAARIDQPLENSAINVYWNGKLVTGFTPANYVIWNYGLTVCGDSGENRLSIGGGGLSNEYGASIDNLGVYLVSLDEKAVVN